MLDPCLLATHPALKNADAITLASLGAGVMRFLERFTRRKLLSATYDILLPGTSTKSLYLPEYPVTKVEVRSDRLPALQIINDTATAQSALVEVVDTGLSLSLTDNGTTVSTLLSWVERPTIGSLAAAVNALGSGWRAILSPRFATWASADLKPYKGVRSARQLTVSLSPHWMWLSDFRTNEATGELIRETGWWGGPWSYRVAYTAGYPTLPDDLALAAVELAGATHSALRTDPNLLSESLGQYSYTRATLLGWDAISLVSRQAVQSYRRTSVPYFKA